MYTIVSNHIQYNETSEKTFPSKGEPRMNKSLKDQRAEQRHSGTHFTAWCFYLANSRSRKRVISCTRISTRIGSARVPGIPLTSWPGWALRTVITKSLRGQWSHVVIGDDHKDDKSGVISYQVRTGEEFNFEQTIWARQYN